MILDIVCWLFLWSIPTAISYGVIWGLDRDAKVHLKPAEIFYCVIGFELFVAALVGLMNLAALAAERVGL